MLIINHTREVFQPLATHARYAEVGVFKGMYAKGVKRYKPREMYLIDPWTPAPIENLIPADYLGDPVQTLEGAISEYYSGGMEKALELAYREVVQEFGSDENCRIIRKTSSEAYSDFPAGTLDVIYIDGNHRYDYVLADLERWSPKVDRGGYIILNDCYVSPIGKLQHMSVLEAVSTFIKLTEWRVVAAVNQDYTDVVLTRTENLETAKASMIALLLNNSIKFIELPASLIHCMHHRKGEWIKDGKRHIGEYMSFG
jgi:hypothetical protein